MVASFFRPVRPVRLVRLVRKGTIGNGTLSGALAGGALSDKSDEKAICRGLEINGLGVRKLSCN